MRRSLPFAFLFVFADVALFAAVMNFSAWLRGVVPWGDVLIEPILGPALVVIIAIYLIDGYRPRTDMISLDFTSLHLIAVLTALIVTLLATFVVAPTGFPLRQSRVALSLGFTLFWPLSLITRRLFQIYGRPEPGTRTILFIGRNDDAQDFVAECRRTQLPVTVETAMFEPTRPPFEVGKTEPSDYAQAIQRVVTGELKVEAIILRESARNLSEPVIESLQALFFSGIPTFTLELFHQVYWRKIPLYRINNTWLFQEGFKVAREPVFDRLKRASDVLLASVGLLISSPLVALAAVAIVLTDGFPVFFRQTRIGRLRQPFTALKLRTMRPAAGPTSTPDARYTSKADPRVTKVGKFLRLTRLDELPQLWNVLKGDMSLIGPRAEWDVLVAEYERAIPCYHFRHLVRPGITGWAQINYPYGANVEDTRRKLEYDLFYIRHYSFRMDASIILKTIHVMLFGKGR